MKKKATQEELERLRQTVETLRDQLHQISILVGLRGMYVPDQPAHVKWVREDSPEWKTYQDDQRAQYINHF